MQPVPNPPNTAPIITAAGTGTELAVEMETPLMAQAKVQRSKRAKREIEKKYNKNIFFFK
jgi:hypothetical protein